MVVVDDHRTDLDTLATSLKHLDVMKVVEARACTKVGGSSGVQLAIKAQLYTARSGSSRIISVQYNIDSRSLRRSPYHNHHVDQNHEAGTLGGDEAVDTDIWAVVMDFQCCIGN